MMQKKLILFMLLLTTGITFIYAQNRSTSQEDLMKTGISFYSEGKYPEAASILQLAGSSPETLYWLSLAELSSGNFDKSLSTLNALEKAEPVSSWSFEVPYHRGRCFYYLGRHEEAISSFLSFINTLPDTDPRRPSAYYWQGESLLALGRLENAADAFSMVVENYPNSAKYEASCYRLNLINQKKVETELLALLKWSHEESLKSIEEYQEREKNYEIAIASYQKRLSELLAASGETTLQNQTASAEYYQDKLVTADQKIAELETKLTEANTDLLTLRESSASGSAPLTDMERSMKILELKALTVELSRILTQKLNEVDQ